MNKLFNEKQLRWCGYPILKMFDDIFRRLNTVLTCDGQTDGRTDRHTDILRQHSPSYANASRNKSR